MKITKKMSFMEAMQKRPETAEVLMRHGLHCIGCMMAHMETIEQGCKAHGMNDKEIEKIVEEINSSGR